MKFQVNQSFMQPLLAQCSAVADKKSTMPVLGNILITANGKVSLSATDLYQAVHTSVVDGVIQETGSVAVDARALVDRVKYLTGDIAFSVKDNTLTLKSGKRTFKLQTVPGEEFPSLPDSADAKPLLTIASADLASLINRVRFAISTDETRLHLNSMLLEADDDDILRAVATDGHRLSVAEITAPTASAFSILIPLSGVVSVLLKLCDSADTIELSQRGLVLFAKGGEIETSVKLADAQFPPWGQVVPESSTSTATINRAALLGSIKAVAVAASDRTGAVKLEFKLGKLRVAAEGPETGEGEDELAIDYDGPDAVVGVNSRYLCDALGAVDCEEMTMGVSGELDPVVVKPVGDVVYTGILMPMRC
jgi:DNA polymerase-3 subunit beta